MPVPQEMKNPVLAVYCYKFSKLFHNMIMFLVFLPFHVRMPLLLKEEKLKCLTSQLHMGRHLWGFPRIGR